MHNMVWNRKGGAGNMQRPQSQRQVKKVAVPCVPEVPGLTIACPPQQSTPTHSSRQSNCSSYGSMSIDSAGGCPFSPSHINHTSSLPHNKDRKPLYTTNVSVNGAHSHRAASPDDGAISAGSPKHRNSTGSNSSQASSGFESMKSAGGGAHANSSSSSHTVMSSANVFGGSGSYRVDSRNSCHSSGSGSSIGSMERLDEMGSHATQVNPRVLLLNGVPDHDVLTSWLTDLCYHEYVSLFLNHGYDMPTVARMTPEDLTAIGITKPGHRKRLTSEIHKLNIPDGLPETRQISLPEWLQCCGLSQYLPEFQKQGYFSLDQVLKLCWEDFEDIGVKKLGHVKKLGLAIKKLQETSHPTNVTLQNNGISSTGPAVYASQEVVLIHCSQQPCTSNTAFAECMATAAPTAHVKPMVQFPLTQSNSPLRSNAGITTFCQDAQDRLCYQPEMVQIQTDGHAATPVYRLIPATGSPVVNRHPGCSTSSTLPSTLILTTDAQIHHQHSPSSPNMRPKVTVKPRPVAKIVAKTKRNSREIPQDIIYYDQMSPSQHHYLDDELTAVKAQNRAVMNNYATVSVDGHAVVDNNHFMLHNGAVGVDACGNASGEYFHSQLSPARMSHNNSNCLRPPPPPVPPKSRLGGMAASSTSDATSAEMTRSCMVFQLSSTACSSNSVDDMVDMSASVDDFPPPPSPLRCEEQISKLKSIRQQSSIDECSSLSAIDKASSLSPSVVVNRQYQSSTVINIDTIAANNRSSSSGSSTGGESRHSSQDTLPFAQENVGTIKQKSPRAIQEDAVNGILSWSACDSTKCGSPMNGLVMKRSIKDVFPVMNGHGETILSADGYKNAAASSDVKKNNNVVLEEIDSMLQGLTNELDALLTTS